MFAKSMLNIANPLSIFRLSSALAFLNTANPQLLVTSARQPKLPWHLALQNLLVEAVTVR
jgi:hypothetical protein